MILLHVGSGNAVNMPVNCWYCWIRFTMQAIVGKFAGNY